MPADDNSTSKCLLGGSRLSPAQSLPCYYLEIRRGGDRFIPHQLASVAVQLQIPCCLHLFIYLFYFFAPRGLFYVAAGIWLLFTFFYHFFFSQERFLEHSFSFWGRALRGKGFLKARSCVYFAAQRAGSLFSLTDPQLGGPDTRPAASPVQFQTPQTPRTTPTLSR